MSAAETAGIQSVDDRGAMDSLDFRDTVLLYHHVDCSARPTTGKFLVQASSCGLRWCVDKRDVRVGVAYLLELSRNFIGQSNSSEAFSGSVVEQHLIGSGRPDGGQLHGSWSVQDKLESASSSVLAKFQFRHGEMVLEQIFFAAQSDMDK